MRYPLLCAKQYCFIMEGGWIWYQDTGVRLPLTFYQIAQRFQFFVEFPENGKLCVIGTQWVSSVLILEYTWEIWTTFSADCRKLVRQWQRHQGITLRAQYHIHRGVTSRQKTCYLMLILGITIIMQCAGCTVLRYGSTTTAFADHGLSECTLYMMMYTALCNCHRTPTFFQLTHLSFQRVSQNLIFSGSTVTIIRK